MSFLVEPKGGMKQVSGQAHHKSSREGEWREGRRRGRREHALPTPIPTATQMVSDRQAAATYEMHGMRLS